MSITAPNIQNTFSDGKVYKYIDPDAGFETCTLFARLNDFLYQTEPSESGAFDIIQVMNSTCHSPDLTGQTLYCFSRRKNIPYCDFNTPDNEYFGLVTVGQTPYWQMYCPRNNKFLMQPGYFGLGVSDIYFHCEVYVTRPHPNDVYTTNGKENVKDVKFFFGKMGSSGILTTSDESVRNVMGYTPDNSTYALPYWSASGYALSSPPAQQTVPPDATLGVPSDLTRIIPPIDYTDGARIVAMLIYQKLDGTEIRMRATGEVTYDGTYYGYGNVKRMISDDGLIYLNSSEYQYPTIYIGHFQHWYLEYSNAVIAYITSDDTMPATFADVVPDVEYTFTGFSTHIIEHTDYDSTDYDSVVFRGQIHKKTTVTSYHIYLDVDGVTWVCDYTITGHPYVVGEEVCFYNVTSYTYKYVENQIPFILGADSIIDENTLRKKSQYPFDYTYTDHIHTPAAGFSYTKDVTPAGLVYQKKHILKMGFIKKWF